MCAGFLKRNRQKEKICAGFSYCSEGRIKLQMRKKDKEVEILLHGQQWQYLQIIARSFDKVNVSAERMRKYVDDKPQKVRSCLSELVREGFLDAETMLLTESGKETYEKQIFWKNELIWWMNKLRVPMELIDEQADILMDTMEPEVIQRIHIQNEYIRTLEVNRSSQETFHNSDLNGKLMKGRYKVKIVFLDLEDKQGNSKFCEFSRLSQCFFSQAELLVEPLKSCLILQWDNRQGSLDETVYLWEGKARHRKARENQLSIPIADFNFTHVRAYEILEGKLDMAVKFKDREGLEQRIEACLLVSLPINGKK